jgi:hypothetical protein
MPALPTLARNTGFRATGLAGSLFQTFPISRLLKASMQLSQQALCNLAVKGSSLNKWSLSVSCTTIKTPAHWPGSLPRVATGSPAGTSWHAPRSL